MLCYVVSLACDRDRFVLAIVQATLKRDATNIYIKLVWTAFLTTVRISASYGHHRARIIYLSFVF